MKARACSVTSSGFAPKLRAVPTMTGFAGFAAMIDGVEGLVIDVPFAMNDAKSRAFFEPGVQRLSGNNALAFGRNRHDLPAGDFGRSENQGVLMVSALRQFKKEYTKDPSRILIWVGSFLSNVQTSLPLGELMTLAFTGTAINQNAVTNVVFPGGTGSAGGLSVVHLDQTALATISSDLADDGLLKERNIPPSPNAPLVGEE